MSDPTPYRDDADDRHPADALLGDPEPYAAEEPAPGRRAGSRRAAKKRRGRGVGCLFLALVLVAGFAGALYLGGSWIADRLGSQESTDDFDGGTPVEECATSGDASVTIEEGDSIRQMGERLEEAGVVASVGAFVEAANADQGSTSIQVGTRSMCTEMSSAEAVDLLVDSAFIGGGGITITAGYTKERTFDLLSGATGIPVEEFETAASDPSIPLPADADGDVEGYLYPDSYDFGPDPTALSIITQMVERWSEAATEAGLTDDAVPGFSQHELLTLASIIQKEVLLPEERPAVAEVIYDRLANECAGVPAGLLQMDSTVNFLLGADTGTPFTTAEDRAIQSPYNTYVTPGLPPGPIGSPSEATMEAAVTPSDDGYCYFVAAGDGSNSSYFAATFAEHQENVARAQGN